MSIKLDLLSQNQQFLDMMKDERFQLPLKENEKGYLASLEELYQHYLQSLNFISERRKDAIEMICHSLLDILHKTEIEAYPQFKRFMKLRVIQENISILHDIPVDGYGRSNANLFRLRKVDKKLAYQRKDIFHEPIFNYEHREQYRYSRNEIPSLYLSSTVYCCAKELNLNGQFNDVIGSMYRLDKDCQYPINIINLGNRPIDFVNRKYAKLYYNDISYLFMYPLIAACSVVVPNKQKVNKLEYRLTNFLLQYLVEEYEGVCGIRYFSCYNSSYTIQQDNGNVLCETLEHVSLTKYFINYVFPVDKSDDLQQCYSRKLSDAFVLTMPKVIEDYGTIKNFENYVKRLKLMSI